MIPGLESDNRVAHTNTLRCNPPSRFPKIKESVESTAQMSYSYGHQSSLLKYVDSRLKVVGGHC